MYVIWRNRKLRRGRWCGMEKPGDVRLTPIIAQSRRVNGQPRQEHIACLPSIIESGINEGGAVWFWGAVEERLARLTNRISSTEMEKVRAALDKVVPQPDPEYAQALKDQSRADRKSIAAAFGSNDRVRELNKRISSFHASFKTARTCGDCGEEMEVVYRERRQFGRRFTVGVLCEDCCLEDAYRFYRLGSCETCGRVVFVSHSIRVHRTFCSTRCGQARYREARRAKRVAP